MVLVKCSNLNRKHPHGHPTMVSGLLQARSVVTASQHILLGTVRQTVLRACEKLGTSDACGVGSRLFSSTSTPCTTPVAVTLWRFRQLAMAACDCLSLSYPVRYPPRHHLCRVMRPSYAGVAIDQRPPQLREFPLWGSPFVCSTSRLLLRVSKLAVPLPLFTAHCSGLLDHPRCAACLCCPSGDPEFAVLLVCFDS